MRGEDHTEAGSGRAGSRGRIEGLFDMMGGKAGCHFTAGASVCPAITRGRGSVSDDHAIVETVVNSNGGHVMPTISAGEYKMGQAQKDKGGGYIVHSTSSCTRTLPRR